MVDFGLSGKTALVTGGTAGIGKAVVAQYVLAGAQVAAVGRRDDGDLIVTELGAVFVRADVTKSAEVAAMFVDAEQQLGKLDIVVLNAGVDPGQATWMSTCVMSSGASNTSQRTCATAARSSSRHQRSPSPRFQR